MNLLKKYGSLLTALAIVGTGLLIYSSLESRQATSGAQQFNPALVEARQKCQSDADAWFKAKMQALTLALNTNNWNDSLVGAHFNAGLNTCLVLYAWNKTDGSEQVEQIVDIYQSRVVLELDIYTDLHSPLFGTHLLENTNVVKLWPWQNASDDFWRRKAVLFEEQTP